MSVVDLLREATEAAKREMRFVECPACGWGYSGGPGNGGMPADKCPACGTELVDWSKP